MGLESTAKGRRHFAAGEYVTRFPERAPPELRIDSPRPKPEWQPRRPGDQTHAEHAGSAVLFEGAYWEVVRGELLANRTRYLYTLTPWDDRHPLPTPLTYDRRSCEDAARAFERRLRSRSLSNLLRLLGPVVALLPAADQRRLERELGFPAVRSTLVGAAMLWSASTGILIAGFAQSMASRPLPGLAWTQPLAPFAIYFGLESFVRFLSAIRLDEPMGSLPVWLPVETARAVRSALQPEARLERRRMRAEGRVRRSPLEGARDVIRELQDEEGGLEIVSLLPKPHWTVQRSAIYLGDRALYLEDRRVVEAPDGLRHHFRLRPVEEGMFFKEAHRYDPTEVQELARQERRRAQSTWVETLAPLWGFLEPELQEELARLYDYDAELHTLRSGILGMVLGGAAVAAAGGYVRARTAGMADVLVLLFGLLLLSEGVARFRLMRRGEMTGGLLGKLLAPVARRFLN